MHRIVEGTLLIVAILQLLMMKRGEGDFVVHNYLEVLTESWR